MIRKPRNQMAQRLVIQSLETQQNLYRSSISRDDIQFLKDFLMSPEVKGLLKITDDITVPAMDNNQHLDALIRVIRPKRAIDRNCLELLSDVWTNLEALVMKTSLNDEPDAHELYDLLADDHLRQFLVACDDVANKRYETFTHNENTDDFSLWQDIYVESETPRLTTKNAGVVKGPTREENESINSKNSRVREAAKLLESRLGMNLPTAAYAKIDTRRIDLKKLADPIRVDLSEDEDNTPVPISRKANANSYSDSRPIEYAEIQDLDDVMSRGSSRRFDESEHTFNPLEATTTKPSNPTGSRLSSRNNKDYPPSSFVPRRNSNDVSPDEYATVRAKRSAEPAPLIDSAKSPTGSSFLENKENFDRQVNRTEAAKKSERKLSSDKTSNLTIAEIERILPNPGEPRLVQLRREQVQEPLGFTIATREPGTVDMFTNQPDDDIGDGFSSGQQHEVIIQRIMAGSLADRSGLLYPGDILVNFNGTNVKRLDQALSLIRSSVNLNEVQMVVKAPNKGVMRAHLANKSRSSNKVYIKTYISYDPRQDKMMPAGDVGLAFKCGDILELVNSQDDDWWQVRRLSDVNGKARLIPSLMLEEKRQASRKATKKTKSIKKFFSASEPSPLLVRSDLWIYEEVVPWPPCTLPCLVLIGPHGVGKRTLKKFLSQRDPKRFCIPITDTTDETLRSSEYHIVSNDKMQADIKNGHYFDWIQAKNHFFGIRFAAIREIINRGSTAIIDCEISNVHLLRMPEFNPIIIFVSSPVTYEQARVMHQNGVDNNLTMNRRSDDELRSIVSQSIELSERYRHIYDFRLINDNYKASTDKLAKMIYRHAKEPGWIPAQWAYQMSVPQGANVNKNKTYFPGSSSLSALGISSLPAGKRTSIITKDSSSIISGQASEISVPAPPPPASHLESQVSAGGRIYEKRKATNNYNHKPYQPQGPALVEIPTPSESLADDDDVAENDDDNFEMEQRGRGRPGFYSQRSLENAERIIQSPIEGELSSRKRQPPPPISSLSSLPAGNQNNSRRGPSYQLNSPTNRPQFPRAHEVSESEISSTSSEEDQD